MRRVVRIPDWISFRPSPRPWRPSGRSVPGVGCVRSALSTRCRSRRASECGADSRSANGERCDADARSQAASQHPVVWASLKTNGSSGIHKTNRAFCIAPMKVYRRPHSYRHVTSCRGWPWGRLRTPAPRPHPTHAPSRRDCHRVEFETREVMPTPAAHGSSRTGWLAAIVAMPKRHSAPGAQTRASTDQSPVRDAQALRRYSPRYAMTLKGWRRRPRTQLPSDWEQRRAIVLARDQHRCVDCGSTQRLEVVHIANLDDHAPSNLQTLCAHCRGKKDARRRRPT